MAAKSVSLADALGSFLYFHVFLKRPLVKNWILFESFFGYSFSDSPKYIYEYISANLSGKYKCIWVINNRKKGIPFRHKKVKRSSLSYYYYLARCGYYVFNNRQPAWMVKREGNVFLQTWYETPLSRLDLDIEGKESAAFKYKQQLYKQSKDWDYIIGGNDYGKEIYRSCFSFEKTILNTGYPRNDILYSPDRDQIAAIIRRRLGIPGDRKTLLYVPTCRYDEAYDKGQHISRLHLNLDLMKQELGDEYIMLIRTNYYMAGSLNHCDLSGFVYNVSKYDDITELYLVTDILITDYSSVIFDYTNLKRPILFYTYDLVKHRDIHRGFYLKIDKELPGPMVFTSQELIAAIKDIASIMNRYQGRYEEFYYRFCGWEDGQATQKVVESVFRTVGE